MLHLSLVTETLSWEDFTQEFILKVNKPYKSCTNLNIKPARLILKVLKRVGMLLINQNNST